MSEKLKLKLNKKTLEELQPDAMKYIRGGLTIGGCGGHTTLTCADSTPATSYTCGSCTSETC